MGREVDDDRGGQEAEAEGGIPIGWGDDVKCGGELVDDHVAHAAHCDRTRHIRNWGKTSQVMCAITDTSFQSFISRLISDKHLRFSRYALEPF
jgi:hypothetical protein